MSGAWRWLLLLVPLLCGCGAGGPAPVERPAIVVQRLGLAVSPEVRFGSSVLGPEGAYQGAGAVAVGSQVSLVVWEDDRDGETDLYGTRLDPQGGVMDSTGFPIATGPDRQSGPAVAFDGTNFLVAWVEGGAIRAVQVDPRGQLPDPVPKTVAAIGPLTGNTTLSLAAAAGGYLLAWSAVSIGAEDVWATRLSLAGVPLEATPISIATAAGLGTLPVVASDGTGFLVAWVDQRVQPTNVRAARISPAGAVLDPGGFRVWASAQLQGAPSAAFNAGAYLVAWATGAQLSAVRIDPGGGVLGAGPVSIDAAPRSRPKVARLGDGFLVAWQSNDKTLRAARLGSSGAVLDPGWIEITPAGPGAAASDVGGGGTHAWVVWPSLTLPDVHAARIDSDGLLVDPAGVLVTTAVNSQLEPQLAFGADAGLIAWTGFEGGQPRIHAVVQEGDGASSPASWVSASTITGANFALSASPAGYLVAWSSSGTQWQVRAARLTLEGTLKDSPPLLLGEGPVPAVGFDGVNQLVIWSGDGPERGSLRSSRISVAQGLLAPAPLPIPTSNLNPAQVTLAFDGTGYLVLWSESWLGCLTRALRLTAQGAPLEADGDAIPVGQNACTSLPRVAFGHGRYLVVWTEHEGTSNLGIFGRWITAAGELKSEPFPIAGGPGAQDFPAVAFDGEGFVVAWEDLQKGGTRQVQAATVSADGRVTGTQKVTSGGQPRLSSAGPGRTALAYLDYDASPAIRTRQLGLRFLTRVAGGTVGVVPDLSFESPPAVPAQCGRRWEVPVGPVSEPGPYRFQLAVAPEGMSVEPDTGWLSWLPDRSQQGHHRVRLELSAGGRLAFEEFVVEVRCAPSALSVGCQATPGVPGLLAAWLWWLAARRRARPATSPV